MFNKIEKITFNLKGYLFIVNICSLIYVSRLPLGDDRRSPGCGQRNHARSIKPW